MTALFEAIVDLWVFAVGTVVGSFANVCVHRLPRGESVVFPGSRCPSCRSAIAARDNVPILSWLLLRGRCRSCRAPISPRYPLVEAATGALFLLARFRFGLGFETVSAAALLAACLVLTLTDLESRVLPDEVTLGGLVLALLLALGQDLLAGAPFDPWESRLLAAVAGAAAGFLLLLGVRVAYERFRGEEGMGLGDVKMIAMVGAFLGPAGVFLTLLLGSLLGAALGAALWAGRQSAFARARRGFSLPAPELPEGLALRVSSDGRVVAAGRRWTEIPGAPGVGAPVGAAGPVARRVAAFVRLSRRRARLGLATAFGRLAVDDGADFFRVLSARAEGRGGELFVQLSRADIPFGVFLAAGAAAALLAGRSLLVLLLADAAPPGALLLP